jgi:hypothetical protein
VRGSLTGSREHGASQRLTKRCLPHARARERVVPISELVFATLTQTGVVLSLLLELPRLPARPALRNGGTFIVDFVDGRHRDNRL